MNIICQSLYYQYILGKFHFLKPPKTFRVIITIILCCPCYMPKYVPRLEGIMHDPKHVICRNMSQVPWDIFRHITWTTQYYCIIIILRVSFSSDIWYCIILTYYLGKYFGILPGQLDTGTQYNNDINVVLSRAGNMSLRPG